MRYSEIELKVPMIKGVAFQPPVLRLLAILPLKSTLPLVTKSMDGIDDDDDDGSELVLIN